MKEKMKEALSNKVDSREKFFDLLREVGYYDCYVSSSGIYITERSRGFPLFRAPDLTPRSLDTVPNEYWWWAREALREWSGLYLPYDSTTTLDALMKHAVTAMYYPHISTKDPERIAVTMSAADGERDKQTTISVGRFLRRVFVTLPDTVIQEMEASHRADLSDELEIVRDADAIYEVYTTMRGDTGCMRHEPGYWGLDVHPSIVYASPGLGVAVVRDLEGVPVARSVVYENPADPTDKRYVRIYGDPTLKRRLERNGYRLAGLAGAVLDAHPVEDTPDAYVMPYIDSPGGNGSGVLDGCVHAAVLKGGAIHLLGEDKAATVREVIHGRDLGDGYYVAPRLTSGKVYLKPLPDDLINWTCCLTGQTYDATEHKPVLVATAEGEVREAHPDAVAEDWVFASTRHEGRNVSVQCPPNTPLFQPKDYYLPWIDTEANRLSFGYRKLDAELYPDDRNWYPLHEVIPLSGGRIVLREDVAVVNTPNGIVYVLKSEVDDSWVRLHRSARYPHMVVYSHPDAKWGVTRSGTKVGEYTHDVQVTHDGNMEFTRNLDRRTLPLGQGNAWFYSDEPQTTAVIEVAKARARARIDKEFDLWMSTGAREWMDSTTQSIYLCSWVGDSFSPVRNANGYWVTENLGSLSQPPHVWRTALERLEAFRAAEDREQLARNSTRAYLFLYATGEARLELLRYINERADELYRYQNTPVEAPTETNVRYVVAA